MKPQVMRDQIGQVVIGETKPQQESEQMYKRILESWAEKSPWTVLAFVLLWVLVQYVLIPSQNNAKAITEGVISSMSLQVTALTELTSVVERFTLQVPGEHKELQRAMADIGESCENLTEHIRSIGVCNK